MKPDFFFSNAGLSMVLGDVQGPGLYVRLDSEPPESVRLHIQYGPNFIRSGKTMLRGWAQFKERVTAAAGVNRMVFKSKSLQLVGFCQRCFGFTRVANTDDYELWLGGAN